MKLVTVAVYNLPTQAQIARNALTEAGIWAVIADAELVAMELVLTNAVGGVKVQVKEEDLARAQEVFLDIFGNREGLITTDVDEDELTRQALEAAPDDNEEPPPPNVIAAAPITLPETASDESRDSYARRCFHSVLFAFFIPPLAFYAIYLWLNALFGPGPLSPAGRRKVAFVSVLLLLLLGVIGWLMIWNGINTFAWSL